MSAGKFSSSFVFIAQDRDRWRALVIVVMKLWVLQNEWNFLISNAMLVNRMLCQVPTALPLLKS
jgi:hypothetical protein